MTYKPVVERVIECPICGSKEHIKYRQSRFSEEFTYTIYCEKCNVKSIEHGTTLDRARTAAVKSWNSSNYVQSDIKQEKVKESPKVEIKKSNVSDKNLSKEKFSVNVIESLDRNDIVRLSKYLIKKFVEAFPKEDCPVTLGDLLKLFRLSNEEIQELCGIQNTSKKFLKSWDDILLNLRIGNSIYYTDTNGRVWKYSSVNRDNDFDKLREILESAGLTLKNTYILKK